MCVSETSRFNGIPFDSSHAKIDTAVHGIAMQDELQQSPSMLAARGADIGQQPALSLCASDVAKMVQNVREDDVVSLRLAAAELVQQVRPLRLIDSAAHTRFFLRSACGVSLIS